MFMRNNDNDYITIGVEQKYQLSMIVYRGSGVYSIEKTNFYLPPNFYLLMYLLEKD